MDEKFTKPYDPQATEGRIYKAWEKSGYFNPDNLPARHEKPFTIIMPPPNVTEMCATVYTTYDTTGAHSDPKGSDED